MSAAFQGWDVNNGGWAYAGHANYARGAEKVIEPGKPFTVYFNVVPSNIRAYFTYYVANVYFPKCYSSLKVDGHRIGLSDGMPADIHYTNGGYPIVASIKRLNKDEIDWDYAGNIQQLDAVVLTIETETSDSPSSTKAPAQPLTVKVLVPRKEKSGPAN